MTKGTTLECRLWSKIEIGDGCLVSIASDIIDRADAMASDRINWVNVWIDIAKLVLPTELSETSFSYMMFGGSSGSGHAGRGSNIGMAGPNSTSRVKSIYDNTGMMACDRLASGMESLVTPQSEKWHGLTVADVLHDKTTDEENIYLERLRNFQFALRYDPRAGFIPSHQKAMRSCVAFGTGVVYVEQDDGRTRAGDNASTPFRYQYCPLNENLLATNDYGNVDTNYRVRNFTVKQLVNKFTYKKVSSRVQTAWDNQEFDQTVPVVHAVCPRMEMGSNNLEGTMKGSQIASYYCEVEQKHMLDDGGFHEFPFAIYHWLQQDNGPYAELPVMLALSEIKSLQLMGKGELRAFGQWTDPPLGMPNDGVMNRPNLNPRAVNPGAVGPDGSLRVKPLITAQSPDFAEKVMEVRRAAVKETLYINLFQTLIKNPEMTATEAMIRSNEKGELLGPAGGKISGGAVADDRPRAGHPHPARRFPSVVAAVSAAVIAGHGDFRSHDIAAGSYAAGQRRCRHHAAFERRAADGEGEAGHSRQFRPRQDTSSFAGNLRSACRGDRSGDRDGCDKGEVLAAAEHDEDDGDGQTGRGNSKGRLDCRSQRGRDSKYCHGYSTARPGRCRRPRKPAWPLAGRHVKQPNGNGRSCQQHQCPACTIRESAGPRSVRLPVRGLTPLRRLVRHEFLVADPPA